MLSTSNSLHGHQSRHWFARVKQIRQDEKECARAQNSIHIDLVKPLHWSTPSQKQATREHMGSPCVQDSSRNRLFPALTARQVPRSQARRQPAADASCIQARSRNRPCGSQDTPSARSLRKIPRRTPRTPHCQSQRRSQTQRQSRHQIRFLSHLPARLFFSQAAASVVPTTQLLID